MFRKKNNSLPLQVIGGGRMRGEEMTQPFKAKLSSPSPFVHFDFQNKIFLHLTVISQVFSTRLLAGFFAYK